MLDLSQVPRSTVLLTKEVAELERCSPKALLNRVRAGKFLKPFPHGRGVAWLAGELLDFQMDRARRAREADPPVQVTIATYRYKNTTGLQAIWKMPCPTTKKELKTTALVPSNITDREEARTWALGQVGSILPILLKKAGGVEAPPAPEPVSKEQNYDPITKPSPERKCPTLREFVEGRFDREYIAQWKPSSQAGIRRIHHDHLIPFFGHVPLDRIDDDLISQYRGTIMVVEPGTRNLRLSKLRVALRFAKKLKMITELPEIERFPDPRKPKKPFKGDEIDQLIDAGEELNTEALVATLLAIDAGLRKSEIKALTWDDVDLKKAEVSVERAEVDGTTGTPKGILATIALSEALVDALALLKQEHGPRRGPLVLYRKSRYSGGVWAVHTDSSIDHVIHKVQKRAGVRKTGPHLLRHTSVTHLADLGATTTELQAHARHVKLETTERYIHQDKVARSKSAIERLNTARTSKRTSKKSKSPVAGAASENSAPN